MTLKSPVLAEQFQYHEIVYGALQDEYQGLPAIRTPAGKVLTRWTFTDEEREAIHAGADVFLTVLTFNQPLQPLRMEVGVCDRDIISMAQEMGLLDKTRPT